MQRCSNKICNVVSVETNLNIWGKNSKKTYTEANSDGVEREGFGYFSSRSPTITSESGIHFSSNLITGTFPSGFTSKNLKPQPQNKSFTIRVKKNVILGIKRVILLQIITIWACH